MAYARIPIAFVLILILFSQILCQDASEGQCVMYGQCGEGDYGSLNCVYNGKAKPVEDQDAISMLKQICPEYVDGDKALTCCDPQQIEAMEGNFKLPERLLGKCPSCFYNFRKTFCKLTCSPNQSQYMKVMGTQKSDDGKDMVTELIYYVAESFSNGLFNSCKSVEGIIPGTRVIDLMCGGWGSKCNGERWLRFMGSTPENQGFSPVQINYTFTSEPKVEEHGQIFYPMAENTHKCNVSPAQGVKACDCSNCPNACPKTSTTTTTSTTTSATTTTSSSTTVETSSALGYSEAPKDTETIAPDGDSEGISIAKDSSSNPTSGAAESRPKLLNNKLFRRILSPLIVIAPAFADD